MEKGEEIVPSVGRLVGLKLITARVHGRLRRPAGGGGEGNGGGGHMMYSARAGGRRRDERDTSEILLRAAIGLVI